MLENAHNPHRNAEAVTQHICSLYPVTLQHNSMLCLNFTNKVLGTMCHSFW